MADLSFGAALGFARDLIRIPSPPGGEGEVGERLLLELNRLGFDRAWRDEVGNVIGVVEGRGEAKPVMLSCHLDIVDPGDPTAWEHAPYAADVTDGFLHGRGAMDIKGPLALQTYAAAHFVAERPAGDVIVAHTVLEERGGWGMEYLLESDAVSPGVAIVGESTHGDVTIGHRGRAEIVVSIHGLAGHASAPDRAVNALDGLPAVLDAVRAFAAERLAEEDPVLGRASVVATQVEVSPASRNVIPDLVRVYLDWRVLPGHTPDTAAGAVRDFLAERVHLDDERLRIDVDCATELQHTCTGREAARRLFTPGFLVPRDHPAAVAAADVIAHVTGHTPDIRPWTFATDGGHICGVHGIPTIGYAPGEERYAHTNTERLSLAAAEEAYSVYPQLINALFSVVPVG
ncbi:MAG TPA: M20/M25/M40 family metallo-hydrolase [Longimicrobiales bacterium]|nr:M20/M25/M40 family metallo-hydrolase [Longimicrobiales bacterium]